MPFDNVPVQMIVLEKHTADDLPLQVGTLYTYTYKSLRRFDALARARKALERDHKGEDAVAHWKALQ